MFCITQSLRSANDTSSEESASQCASKNSRYSETVVSVTQTRGALELCGRMRSCATPAADGGTTKDASARRSAPGTTASKMSRKTLWRSTQVPSKENRNATFLHPTCWKCRPLKLTLPWTMVSYARSTMVMGKLARPRGNLRATDPMRTKTQYPTTSKHEIGAAPVTTGEPKSCGSQTGFARDLDLAETSVRHPTTPERGLQASTAKRELRSQFFQRCGCAFLTGSNGYL